MPMVSHAQRGAGVLLDQQDADAAGTQGVDDGEDLAHDQRRQAQAGFVQHQQFGLAHQRAAQGQHLALAAGQRAGRLRAALLQAREAGVDALQPVAPALVAPRLGPPAAEQQVVFDAHRAEQLALLGHQGQARHHALFQRQAGDVLAGEAQGRAARRDQAHQRAEQRALAGAVGADDRDDAVLGHRKAQAVQHLGAAIAGVQVDHLEERGHSSAPR
mmetsp:Transcript_5849/g.22958  ORF Transcript_5849/g.22958 Transcript_5849/m.22958 type:complete len:216 (-) Transcript_5849:50-697(-)